MEIINLGREIELRGKSGTAYHGKILEKESETTVTGRAIVCLTNSWYEDAWKHHMNAVYMTDDAAQAFTDFQGRDDISHLILIPVSPHDFSRINKVDDLIQQYIHK